MNILAIGAHFDDIEMGCGGSVARHVRSGDKTIAYVAAKSGYKNPDGEIIRSDETAFTEGRKAIEDVLGAELIQGGFETLALEYGDALFRQLIKIIENYRVDLIYTHWSGDIHRDHNILSKASLHVSRHIPRVLMYRSNWYDGGTPFKGNFYVDISGFYHIKEKALRCHESEINRTSSKWVEFYKNEAVNSGFKANVKYAEAFEIVKWIV